MVISYRPLPKRILKAHAQTSNNYKWLRKNREEIRKDYNNQFIAVARGQVIYNTSTYMDLLDYLSKNRNQPDLIGIRVRPHDHVLLL